MIGIISRAQWGARPPDRVATRPLSAVDTFVVHYSAASRFQSVRSIQDYHMDVKGWSDIGYNLLTDVTGRAFMGRGLDVIGAHVEGHNTHTVGVCQIGTDADVTDDAKRTIRALYDWSCDHFGRTLAMRWHSYFANTPTIGANVTSCPGVRLRTWVQSGMPAPATGPGTPLPDPTPEPQEGVAMFFVKTDDDDLVYVSDGFRRRPMTGDGAPEALAAARAAGIPLVPLDNMAQVEHVAGPLVSASTVDPVFVDAIAEAVRASIGMIPSAAAIARGAIDEYARRLAG